MSTPLDQFKKQNVDYGFSADVMPSTVTPQRALAAPANVFKNAHVKTIAPATDPHGGVLRKDHRRFRGITEAEKAQQITASIVDPPYVPKPKAQAPEDPYANGGDGRVAREERPRNQQVSVAGGVPRDELIRRMEIAARSYAGSPSARAAMMGAYAEQLKAYDTVEINNNQNNNQNDQLTFQQNSSANRQEAQGRQQFGNEVGMLNRKGAIESALAAQTAKANAPLAAAQLAELKSRTLINEASAAQKAGAFDLSTKSMANKNISERIIQMGGDPKDPAQYAQVAAMVGREALLNGDDTSDAAKQIAQQDGVALARPFTESGDRYNGIWARDTNSRTLGEGTSINPGDVEEIADDGSNLYNTAIASWVPGTEADVLTRYKDPKTGEIIKRWLDPSEPEDKAVIDAARTYKNAPGYQKELGPRK